MAIKLPDLIQTEIASFTAVQPLRLMYQDEARVGRIWDELRAKYFHNKTFETLDLLEDHLMLGLRELETQHENVKSITCWDYIIKAVLDGN